MPFERGSRTKRTGLWLLPDDELRFGERVRQLLPEAGWICSQPGLDLHEVHLHSSVAEAMQCGGSQSFLPLPVGASLPASIIVMPGVLAVGSPQEAIVQLSSSRVLADELGEYFRWGGLAVQWIEDEVTPGRLPVLEEQRTLVWRALRETTRPAHLEDWQGRRYSGMRIGDGARDLVMSTGMKLSRATVQRLLLVK